MLKIFIAAAVLVSVLLGSPMSALAMEKSTYVGGLVGANFANGSSSASANTNFGITAGTMIVPHFGLGVYGTYYGENHSDSIFGLPAGTNTRTVNLAAEANAFLSVFHGGFDAGAGINSWDGSIGNNTVSSSNTAFIYGPEAGFDIPLGTSSISVGGEVHYLLTTATNGQSNLQALAALKVWL